MREKKEIYIVSLNGMKNTGGVERVVSYLYDILKDIYTVHIIEKSSKDFKKLNNLLQPALISVKLLFKKNSLIIGNSWQCFLFPADLSFIFLCSSSFAIFIKLLKKAFSSSE